MPTSRYCDQAFCASRTSFTRAASGEPGRTLARSSPRIAAIAWRTLCARAGSPRACSSITRSSMLATKVTPAAFTACRSQGASSQGRLASRVSGGVLDRMSSSAPRRGRSLRRRHRARGMLELEQRGHGRRHARQVPCSAPSRTTHTEGPPTAGSCTRPTSTAAWASSGRLRPPINRSRMRSSALLGSSRRAYPTRPAGPPPVRVGPPACGIIDAQAGRARAPARPETTHHGPRTADPRRRRASPRCAPSTTTSAPRAGPTTSTISGRLLANDPATLRAHVGADEGSDGRGRARPAGEGAHLPRGVASPTTASTASTRTTRPRGPRA